MSRAETFSTVPSSAPIERYRTSVAIACVLMGALSLANVSGRSLWGPDELRFAEVVRAMEQPADWFVPQLWGKVYTEKPPLFFWLLRPLVALVGSPTLVTCLVPVLIASCLGFWLTCRIASDWFGSGTGRLAVIVLASLPLYLLMSQIARMDMLLAVAITAAVYQFYRGYVKDDAASRVGAWVSMGIGVLIKGPFAVLLPVSVAAVALAVAGRWRSIACRETCCGLAAFIGVLSIWLVPAGFFAGFDYWRELVGRQIVTRAVSGLDHGEPPYYYLWVLAILLMPWSPFIGSSLRSAWKAWREGGDESALWLASWFVVPLLIMSVVREKLPVYLLPVMPAAAILLARYWNDVLQSPNRFATAIARRIAIVSIILAVIGLCLLGACVLQFDADWSGRIGEWVRDVSYSGSGELLVRPWLLCLGGAALLGFATAGGFLAASRRAASPATFTTLAAVMPCGMIVMTLCIFPLLDGARSWRLVAEEFARQRQPGEATATYRVAPFVNYYLDCGTPSFQNRRELAEFVAEHGSVCSLLQVKAVRKITPYCTVEYDPDRTFYTTRGRVCVARLRPLATPR